ncbi:MAG: hypothetical protein AB1500_07460 [Bacillota bacterium]
MRLVILVLITAVLATLANGCAIGKSKQYPFCRSDQDIEKHKNAIVRLVGTYRHVNEGKCRVAAVQLEDGRMVVIEYQPPLEEVKRLNNHAVMLTGRILPGYPRDDTGRRYLLLPHLVDIKSLEELKEE